MARVGITIKVAGLDEMIDYFHDLHTKGPGRAHRALDLALDKTAETSRDLAHLHSGRLKESQTHSSDSSDLRGWTGQISYSSRGAPWELQAGGDHAAYIDSLSALSAPDFENALDSIFEDL